MNTEEIISTYEYLVPITLVKMYGTPEKYAKSKHLEYSDLYNFGMIGIWNAAKTYPEKKLGTLRNYIIRNIKWSVRRSVFNNQLNTLYYKSNHPKYAEVNYAVPLLSMSYQPFEDEEKDFYDLVSCDNITRFPNDDLVETKLLANEGYESILSLLTDREKEMVSMRMNEKLSYQQIADRYGVKRQAIGFRFKTLQEKIKRHMGVATI